MNARSWMLMVCAAVLLVLANDTGRAASIVLPAFVFSVVALLTILPGRVTSASNLAAVAGAVTLFGTFDGKVITMEWKLVGKRDGLVTFLDPKPQKFEKDRDMAWVTSKTMKDPVYGYQKEGWQGAPWIPTNLVGVKRPMYVIELKPKDPYYNHGPQEFWIDAENQILTVWKVIHDRAGKYWKTTWESWSGYEGADENCRAIVAPTLMMIDERTDHTTIIRLVTPEYQVSYYDSMDRNDFTLAGFQKFCK